MMVVVEAGMDIVLWNEGSEILMPEEVWEHRIKTEGFDCIKQYFLVAALKKKSLLYEKMFTYLSKKTDNMEQ